MRHRVTELIIRSLALFATFGLLLVCGSCKKGFLDAKPKQYLVLLNTVKNLQGVLDNDLNMNHSAGMKEEGADDFYFTPADFLTLTNERDKNVYTWSSDPDFYQGSNVNGWQLLYYMLFPANTVLEEIDKITPDAALYADWANVKGSALFYRAYAFHELAQLFCKPYIAASASTDLGILLRLSPDINRVYGRATVQETYDRILSDLLEAKDLLPVTPVYKTRPSRTAAYAMLARVYLSMQDYDKAYTYADLCLQDFNTLINYNTLDTSLLFPFPSFRNNQEMIYYAANPPHMIPTTNRVSNVDTFLFSLYDNNDLRKSIFFHIDNGRRIFTGCYLGTPFNFFFGLATDEVLLIRAECLARKGNKDAAMDDLRTLLENRWKPGTLPPVNASNPEDALRKVLVERRKELCFRGIRWSDLRRLNMDDRFKDTLTRVTNTQTYILLPNDNRYVYPIPNNEILYNSIPQNPR